jgi:hypothetical protein
MDSCKQAIGGAAYAVGGGGGTSVTVTTPAGPSNTVAPATQCPLEQGSCTGTSDGCASFAVPAPGTYTIRETVTPPGNTTNPEGYAPCEGGSACRSEVANLVVSGGRVSATVTAVYPDGTSVTWPSSGSYSGSPSDPIVFHDFGLAAPGDAHNSECDGDGDADDHLTGTPSGHCAYPESQEASACQPFPWSCQISGGAGAPVPSGSGGVTPGQNHSSGGTSRGSGAGSSHTSSGSGSGSGSGGGSSHTSSGSGSGAGSRHNGSARSFRSS